MVSWSSGKDSAWALYLLRQRPDIEVVGLFTTVNNAHQRVAMHAVRVTLLEKQAASAGLPLHVIPIPHPCRNHDYEAAMTRFIETARRRDVQCMAFGDLYLQDVRDYREHNLRHTGITPIFPLWGLDTRALCHDMIDRGLRARITCVDPRRLGGDCVGREYDWRFLQDLPVGWTPAGRTASFTASSTTAPCFAHPSASSAVIR
jgi:diphthamide synthase (EF-2-diphthine--ammonia ligase)